jgi:phage tail sheath gpL-like
MSIQFNTIPSTIRVPLFWNEFAAPAAIGLSTLRTILIGQTITATPMTPQPVSSPDQVKSICGRGSMLAKMAWGYFKNNPGGVPWILPVADAVGATSATGTLALTGPATAAGTLPLYIAGEPVFVAVAAAQTATALATAVAAAVTAQPDLPVTATATTGTVTFTAKNGGVLGNDIDIRLAYLGAANGEYIPAGITAAITPMTGGTGDPDLAAPLAALGSLAFEFIAHPYTGSGDLAESTAFMNNATGRWSYSQMLFGHVFTVKRGGTGTGATAAATAATALLAIGAALNDPHLTDFGFFDSPSWSPVIAGEVTGFADLSVNADNAPPPFQGGVIQGMKAPPPASQFTFAQIQALLSSGIACFTYGADGTVSICRAITTYQTDSSGTPDASYLDCETMFALASFVRFIRNRLQSKFARAKLAKDGTNFGAGSSAIVTPNIARAEVIAAFDAMIDLGWVQDLAGFQAALVVEINPNDPTRLDMLIPANIIPGLHILASQTQLNLGG